MLLTSATSRPRDAGQVGDVARLAGAHFVDREVARPRARRAPPAAGRSRCCGCPGWRRRRRRAARIASSSVLTLVLPLLPVIASTSRARGPAACRRRARPARARCRRTSTCGSGDVDIARAPAARRRRARPHRRRSRGRRSSRRAARRTARAARRACGCRWRRRRSRRRRRAMSATGPVRDLRTSAHARLMRATASMRRALQRGAATSVSSNGVPHAGDFLVGLVALAGDQHDVVRRPRRRPRSAIARARSRSHADARRRRRSRRGCRRRSHRRLRRADCRR